MSAMTNVEACCMRPNAPAYPCGAFKKACAICSYKQFGKMRTFIKLISILGFTYGRQLHRETI